jgi:hypothetical protein
MLYGPHGPGVVPGGPEYNRIISGSSDGLPTRPKHNTAHASGWSEPVSYCAGPCSC